MTKIRAALRRWLWLLVVGALAGAIAGAASVSFQGDPDPSFVSTSVLLFDLTRSSSASLESAQQAALRVERGSVPARAAKLLERNDPEALLGQVAVSVDGDSLSLVIRSTDPDADEAIAIADAFTTAFLETSNQQEIAALDDQVALLEGQVEAAERRLQTFDTANPTIRELTDTRIPLVKERTDLLGEISGLVQQLDDTREQRENTTGPYDRLGEPTVAPAGSGVLTLPTEPILRVGLLAGLGFFVAALVVAMIERLNPRIDTKEEAESATQLPVLTMIPYLPRRARPGNEAIVPEEFGGGHAESYRRLRSAVQFVSSKGGTHASADAGENGDADRPRNRSFLVVSASPGEGKTSTVAYTAFALAEADVPTLAVNADCRRPTLYRRLGVKPNPGLTDLAEYRIDRPEVDDVAQPGPIEDLWVVASGHPGPLTNELVGAVAQVLDVAASRGATTVIDSSPLLATADVMELVPLVDHIIFVVRNGRTTRREALEALEMLRLRDAPLLGCVCVGAPGTRRKYSYYESYYYHSSASPRGDGPDAQDNGPGEPTGPSGPTDPQQRADLPGPPLEVHVPNGHQDTSHGAEPVASGQQ